MCHCESHLWRDEAIYFLKRLLHFVRNDKKLLPSPLIINKPLSTIYDLLTTPYALRTNLKQQTQQLAFGFFV